MEVKELIIYFLVIAFISSLILIAKLVFIIEDLRLELNKAKIDLLHK